ncbi:hypothetical protein [Blastochloris viridis]|nr:hypothetical protein [Blastochloris viridis]ALK08646.1 hypothetical protein BVIR_853 [Blastochloris viridis]BAR98061.1 hypothetical protein BV133_468 [Blastochloris viridis]
MGRNYIILGLCALLVVVSAFAFSDPETASRYYEMRRSVTLSEDVQTVVMALLVAGIGGYLAWHYLKRD